jgi:hypothetical protein
LERVICFSLRSTASLVFDYVDGIFKSDCEDANRINRSFSGPKIQNFMMTVFFTGLTLPFFLFIELNCELHVLNNVSYVYGLTEKSIDTSSSVYVNVYRC